MARVLVVGGGIGGLTFAVAAARRGIDAQVVERSDPRVRFVYERTQITWARHAGERVEGEPDDLVAFYQRNYGPLIADA